MSKAIDDALLALYEERDKINDAILSLERIAGIASPVVKESKKKEKEEVNPKLVYETMLQYLKDNDGIHKTRYIDFVAQDNPRLRGVTAAAIARLIKKGLIVETANKLFYVDPSRTKITPLKVDPLEKQVIIKILKEHNGSLRLETLASRAAGGDTGYYSKYKKMIKQLIDDKVLSYSEGIVILPNDK